MIYRLQRYRRIARELLIPEILRRREEKRQSRENFDQTGERDDDGHHKDTLDWLEEVSTGEQSNPDHIVHRMLGISFGAIHTTTNHIVNVLLDLATRWDQYAPELRQEIQQIVGSERITERAELTRLSKLDSFMKESQRMNPSVARMYSLNILRRSISQNDSNYEPQTPGSPHPFGRDLPTCLFLHLRGLRPYGHLFRLPRVPEYLLRVPLP